LEAEHRRHFIDTFTRWEALFKRRDGDEAAEQWLVAEYFDSLRHLSASEMDALTAALKRSCTFFPSIKECLDHAPRRYDLTSPDAIGSPAWHEAARIERAADKLAIAERRAAALAELAALDGESMDLTSRITAKGE
jgi:hypothetical protein